MLYPKIKIKKENTKIKEKLVYIKECIFTVLKAFSSYSAFIVFLEQKFHF